MLCLTGWWNDDVMYVVMCGLRGVKVWLSAREYILRTFSLVLLESTVS